MYKIIIADDEAIIREGLSKTVPWNDWGYEVAGLAEDGAGVMKLLEQVRPDVILTDIKMPILDGLKLSRRINENYPNIKIVILSGYNEADYLQEAIKNKVVAYLSKPTDYDEFEEEFKKLKEVLDKEQDIKKERERMREYLNESLPHMREIFFFNLLRGKVDFEDVSSKLEFYKINVPKEDFAVVIIEIDNYYKLFKANSQEKGYLMLRTILYMAGSNFESETFFYDSNNNSVVGICSYEDIDKKVMKLQDDFLSMEELTFSTGVSSRIKEIHEIANKWEEAAQAIRQKIFFGDSSIIFYDDISDLQTYTVPDIRRNVDRIINIIIYKEEGDIEKEILHLFAEFENKAIKNYEYIDKICLEILFALERAVGTSKHTLNNFLSYQNANMLDIFKIESIPAKKEWFLNIVIGFSESAFKERQSSMNNIIKKAIGYIEKNYTSNNFSLDSVAEAVGKNSAYLSNLFKNETGRNFSEYAAELRIEKSKELLLNSNLKVYEIAEQIGYADVSRFTKVFRKHIGISPSEYRMNRGEGYEND